MAGQKIITRAIFGLLSLLILQTNSIDQHETNDRRVSKQEISNVESQRLKVKKKSKFQLFQARSFTIDYDNNTFLMDGRPYQFVGGSFHYFRSLPESWRRKLRAMRAAGLNVLTT